MNYLKNFKKNQQRKTKLTCAASFSSEDPETILIPSGDQSTLYSVLDELLITRSSPDNGSHTYDFINYFEQKYYQKN